MHDVALIQILEIALEYLKVLAWPIVVFTLALVYRKPLIAVLQRLKKYTGLGQTLILGEQARDIREDSEELLHTESTAAGQAPPQEAATDSDESTPAPTPADAGITPTRPDTRYVPTPAKQALFDQIANNDPVSLPTGARRAISAAWRDLYKTTQAIADWLDLEAKRRNLTGVTTALVERKVLGGDAVTLAFRLTELHDALLHQPDEDFSLEALVNFLQASDNMGKLLHDAVGAGPDSIVIR